MTTPSERAAKRCHDEAFEDKGYGDCWFDTENASAIIDHEFRWPLALAWAFGHGWGMCVWEYDNHFHFVLSDADSENVVRVWDGQYDPAGFPEFNQEAFDAIERARKEAKP